MSSRRLPGKALRLIGSQTLLETVLERLSRCHNSSGVHVLTSLEQDDDAIANWCESFGVACFRGSLNNVTDRLLSFAHECGVAAVVRISGDSPFIDPQLVDKAIGMWQVCSADVVTNVHPRCFPRGQSVEVISISALERLMKQPDLSQEDREHITKAFYRDPKQWVIETFAPTSREVSTFAGLDLGAIQLAVDTQQDLVRARLVSGVQSLSGARNSDWVGVLKVYLRMFPDLRSSRP